MGLLMSMSRITDYIELAEERRSVNSEPICYEAYARRYNLAVGIVYLASEMDADAFWNT